MQVPTVTGYVFRPDHMNISARTPGISAFMRCRNGADFVEATIRSHIGFYDEIVVAFNQCVDTTPDILARLMAEFPGKIRVFHYTDRVEPLGSQGHAATPEDAPRSMVNYSNFVLAKTRHQIVVKLDDDHLAIPSEVGKITKTLRQGGADANVQYCFSGFNIARDDTGQLGIPAFDPVVGGGDHGYFRVSEATRFYHDKRFERFGAHRLRREFAGFFYWHLKYLKAGQGFRNYELGDNPESRYARKKQQFEHSVISDLPQTIETLKPAPGAGLVAGLNEKTRLKHRRNTTAAAMFPDPSLTAALDRLNGGWRNIPGLGFVKTD